jgi:hypothetical protein
VALGTSRPQDQPLICSLICRRCAIAMRTPAIDKPLQVCPYKHCMLERCHHMPLARYGVHRTSIELPHTTHCALHAGHTLPKSREACGAKSLACLEGNFCACSAGFYATDMFSRLGCGNLSAEDSYYLNHFFKDKKDVCVCA